MYLLLRVGDLKKQPPCLLQEGCFEQVKYFARKSRYSLTNLFQLNIFLEESMKKFVAAFMAALMTVAVLAAPLRAAQCKTVSEFPKETTVSIEDNQLINYRGGGHYTSCAVAGAALGVAISTGGIAVAVAALVFFTAADMCIAKMAGEKDKH